MKAKLENALKKVDGDDKSKKGNRFTAEQDIQNHSFGISYEPELREKHKDINRLDDENYNYFGKNEEYDVLDAFEQDPIDYDRPCSSK